MLDEQLGQIAGRRRRRPRSAGLNIRQGGDLDAETFAVDHQQRVRLMPCVLEAVTIETGARVRPTPTHAPPMARAGRRWRRPGLELDRRARTIAVAARRKDQGAEREDRAHGPVIEPTKLWSTIDESIGNATKDDRRSDTSWPTPHVVRDGASGSSAQRPAGEA